MLHKITRKIASCLRPRSNTPVFIIGTGRSGTHWVGHILDAHPELRGTIETKPLFDWVVEAALRPDTTKKLLPRIIRTYNRFQVKTAPCRYFDKSHPNIWLADKLLGYYPNAGFIGLERNPFATVSSMLQHQGVLAWHTKWREFPIPNRFLGIDTETAGVYDTLPLAEKCAMRWLAHKKRMDLLKRQLGNNLCVVCYESLILDTESELVRMQNFLGLTTKFPIPMVKRTSLDKWRKHLTPEEINQIAAVVGYDPDDHNTVTGVNRIP